jgi:hypothetical protein
MWLVDRENAPLWVIGSRLHSRCVGVHRCGIGHKSKRLARKAITRKIDIHQLSNPLSLFCSLLFPPLRSSLRLSAESRHDRSSQAQQVSRGWGEWESWVRWRRDKEQLRGRSPVPIPRSPSYLRLYNPNILDMVIRFILKIHATSPICPGDIAAAI